MWLIVEKFRTLEWKGMQMKQHGIAIFVFLSMSCIGMQSLGHYETLTCINDTSFMRCEDDLVSHIEENSGDNHLPLKINCSEFSRRDSSTPCLLEYLQNPSNNKSFCILREDKEHSCPSSDNNVTCTNYRFISRCGLKYTCNETTERCKYMKNENDAKQCKCAKNYHENDNNVCPLGLHIRCDSGVINIKENRNRLRPTLTAYRGQQAIMLRAPCSSTEELNEMKVRCNNLQSCKIRDRKSAAPCTSYLVYDCVPRCGFNDGCNTTTQICVDVEDGIRCDCAKDYQNNSDGFCTAKDVTNSQLTLCANESTFLRCESGVIIIEALQNNERPNITVSCGERVITNYPVPCLSKDEFTKLKTGCDNKSHCKFPDRWNVDGPCYSYLSYKCDDTLTCPLNVQYADGITLTFNQTPIGQIAYSRELCPSKSSNPNTSLSSRECTSHGWEELKLATCYTDDTLNTHLEFMSQINVTDDNVADVARILVLASGHVDQITKDGLDSLITSLASVVLVGNPSPEVTDSVVGVVNNVIAIEDGTLDDTKNVNSIVSLLENQVASVLESGQNYSELTGHMEVNAVHIDRASLQNNYTFYSHLKGTTADIDDGEEGNKTSSIILPASLLQIINEGVKIIPISLITYQDDSLFQMSSKVSQNTQLVKEDIGSHVISATVKLHDVIVKDLPSNTAVVTRFSKPLIDFNKTNITVDFVCVYWDNKEVTWSQEGCRKTSTKDNNEIVCSCNNLTSFAVLVRIYDVTTQEPFYRALSIAGKVGCIICIISLSFSLMALLIARPAHKQQQTHVHLNLCLALLGFYFSFLLGIDKTQNPKLCEAMTSLIYFFCLSSMAWMSVEAFYIYMLIWKLKRSEIRHFIPVAVSFAWGFPAIGSALVYFLEEPHDYENEPDYCFLHPGVVFKFGFVLEIGILFIYNTTVFSLVTYRVGYRKVYFANKEKRKAEIMGRVKSTLSFSTLLGIPWIFAFLSIMQNPPNPVFDIIFCVSVSLQGPSVLYIVMKIRSVKGLCPLCAMGMCMIHRMSEGNTELKL